MTRNPRGGFANGFDVGLVYCDRSYSNMAEVSVDGISFTIERGRTLGVVGESGCGKTTTAKLVLGLEEPTSGTTRLEGKDLERLDSAGRRHYRKSVQAVFQDPHASLNPRMRVSAIIAEPLVTNESLPAIKVAAGT